MCMSIVYLYVCVSVCITCIYDKRHSQEFSVHRRGHGHGDEDDDVKRGHQLTLGGGWKGDDVKRRLYADPGLDIRFLQAWDDVNILCLC